MQSVCRLISYPASWAGNAGTGTDDGGPQTRQLFHERRYTPGMLWLARQLAERELGDRRRDPTA